MGEQPLRRVTTFTPPQQIQQFHIANRRYATLLPTSSSFSALRLGSLDGLGSGLLRTTRLATTADLRHLGGHEPVAQLLGPHHLESLEVGEGGALNRTIIRVYE